jgi:hypothetical protein
MLRILRLKKPKPMALGLLAVVAASGLFCAAADDRPTGAESGLYLKAELSYSIKMSKLKAGDKVEGSLSRDVYFADRKLFSAGSGIEITVDHMEKRKRTPNDHWPWVVQVFTPRHEFYPVFKDATVVQTTGESSLQVSFVSISRMREVHASAKKGKSEHRAETENGAVAVSQASKKKAANPTLVLEAIGIENPASMENNANRAEPNATRPETLAAGTRCKILLLDKVSASKSAAGDVVHARLLEPVFLNSEIVLPAGTLFEGRVVKKTPPRWLSRAGSLYLTFTELTLPGGRPLPIAASLAGAELNQRSHTRMDAEGRLHGERPGAAWMAINFGMTAGIAKEVDDGVQLVIEALVSTATDASTAGTARIISSCASGIYLATRRGRDVVLPRFTEMDIALDRPVSLGATAETGHPAVIVGGK